MAMADFVTALWFSHLGRDGIRRQKSSAANSREKLKEFVRIREVRGSGPGASR